ncbi:MAG: hypothetical protein HY836_18155 [Aquabacterium sp.]|uniref:hypothetical protein n=1 Tax=Aquabacterium sp. TaxID=1872578 RepID=UPI0025BEBCB9|nr:hypothetical protein [Aquabacterium sp.]MBI5927513.1 hypothetical protein [Aquabacterium sp.]
MTSTTWLKPAWGSPAMLCVSLSVAAHALVLTGLQPSGQHRPKNGAPPGSPSMQVRTMAWGSAAPATHLTPTPQPEAPAQEPDLTEPPHDEADMATTDEPPPDQSSDPAQALDTDTSPLPPKPYAEYIPRPQLSVAPIPRVPILIAPPEGDKEPARRVVVLSLYIDESGHVRHIEADDNDMPPAYVQAARAAFMTATFSPGQLEGQQVKSRTRVEVVFDNTPLDSAQ